MEKILNRYVGGEILKRKLEVLRIAEKNDLFEYMKKQFKSNLGNVLGEHNLIRDSSFKALHRETRYEILKG